MMPVKKQILVKNKAGEKQASFALQAGFTLVELMIAMVLGLIIIAAVINMYVGSSRSSAYTQGLQTMQENGRYGVSVLRRGLQLAGYSPAERIDPVDVAASGEDFITVRMRRPYDCNGADTASSPDVGFAVNTYAFDAASSTITCKGDQAGAPAMPIVEGVEQFRVLYGLDTDDDDTPEQFMAFNSDMPPRQIVAVRFAMLVNSGREIRNENTREEHVVLDSVNPTNDRFARSVFGSTVLFRNRL